MVNYNTNLIFHNLWQSVLDTCGIADYLFWKHRKDTSFFFKRNLPLAIPSATIWKTSYYFVLYIPHYLPFFLREPTALQYQYPTI